MVYIIVCWSTSVKLLDANILSIHTLTVTILVCYHFKNHLSPCNNLTFFTDIKNKNDLCHILDFLKCLFMLILLFSCRSKFTTKSTMQENSHTNISLHFSECQISPSLLFVFILSTNLTNVTICGKLY